MYTRHEKKAASPLVHLAKKKKGKLKLAQVTMKTQSPENMHLHSAYSFPGMSIRW